MEKKRSKGVTIFACIQIIGVFAALYGFLVSNQKIAVIREAFPSVPISLNFVIKSHAVFGVILYSTAAIGLLRLFKWARMYTIVLVLLELGYSIIYFAVYILPFVGYSLTADDYGKLSLNLLYAGVVVLLFTRPEVKEQFK